MRTTWHITCGTRVLLPIKGVPSASWPWQLVERCSRVLTKPQFTTRITRSSFCPNSKILQGEHDKNLIFNYLAAWR